MKLLHTRRTSMLLGNVTRVVINVNSISFLSEYKNSEMGQMCCRIYLLDDSELDTDEPLDHITTRLEQLG